MQESRSGNREPVAVLVRKLGVAALFISLTGLGCIPEKNLTPSTPQPDPPNPSVEFDRTHAWLLPGESVAISGRWESADFGGVAVLDRGSGDRTQPIGFSMALTLSGGSEFELVVGAAPAAEPGQVEIEVTASKDFEEAGLVVVRDVVQVHILPSGEGLPGGDGDVVDVRAGGRHAVALLSDGSVWTWGDNRWGQLGNGTHVSSHRPVRVGGLPLPAIEIAAGDRHSLALLSDGTLYGWGARDRNQLFSVCNQCPISATGVPKRLGDVTIDGKPLDLTEGSIQSIDAGGDYSVVRRPDGSISGAGAFRESATDLKTVIESSGVATRSLSAGRSHLIMRIDDGPTPDVGSVNGYGFADSGQLGANAGFAAAETPVVVTPAPAVSEVATGARHSLALLSDGALRTFGNNSFGQLGNGTTAARVAEFQQPPAVGSVLQADGGEFHSLALATTGAVWAWGNNTWGQAGEDAVVDGAQDIQLVPVRVPGLAGIDAISAGDRFNVALDRDCGQVWAWGDNAFGQLGNGGTSAPGKPYPRPVPVFGFGEANASGCPVALTVLSLGDGRGRITIGGTAVVDAECDDGSCATALSRDSVATITASPAAGSGFESWAGDCSGNTPTIDVTLDRSRNCYAVFNTDPGVGPPPTAAFTADPNPVAPGANVTFDGSPSTDDGTITSYDWDFTNDGTFDANGVQVEFAYVNAGVFSARLQVTDDDGLTDETVSLINVTPATQLLQVTLNGSGTGTVSSTPDGIDCGNTCSAQFAVGSSVTLTATAAPGSSFAGWGGDADCSDGVLAMTVDVNCTATFDAQIVQTRTLFVELADTGASGTVTSAPAGINCGNDCDEAFTEDTVVTLTATPDAGAVFTQWVGDADCSDGQVTMDANKTCIAVFDVAGGGQQYTLTFSVTGSGTVTSTLLGINCPTDCSEAYTENTTVFITATAQSGASLLQWGGDCAQFGNITGLSLLMDSDKNCTAQFSSVP